MFQVTVYRLRAEECARRAREAHDEFHKKNFTQLARMWSEMADKAEARDGKAARQPRASGDPVKWAKAS